MDAATKSLDEYLQDVRANFVHIDELILKRGKEDAGKVVPLFEIARNQAPVPLDRAIFSYLIARAFYWQAYHDFKSTRNPQVFVSSRPKVTAAYLDAFEETSALTDQSGVQVRERIVASFAQALATNIWGAELLSGEKEGVIKRFVDPLERTTGAKAALLSNAAVPRMYRNLGIEDRLERSLPQPLPEDYGELTALLNRYERVLLPEQLLPIAQRLEEKHRAAIEKEPATLAQLARVYETNGKTRQAFDLYSRSAATRPEDNFRLYVLAHEEGLRIPPKQRAGYLESFLKGGRLEPRLPAPPDYTREQGYEWVVEFLRKTDRFEECLGVIEQFAKDSLFPHADAASAKMLYHRGFCLEKLGRQTEAVRVYREMLEKAQTLPGSDAQRRVVEDRLRALLKG